MKNSTICLTQALAKDDAYKNQPSCRVLEITAFASHTKCYLEGGFCDVILKNFTNIQCLDNVINGEDAVTKIGIEQVIQNNKLYIWYKMKIIYTNNIITVEVPQNKI